MEYTANTAVTNNRATAVCYAWLHGIFTATSHHMKVLICKINEFAVQEKVEKHRSEPATNPDSSDDITELPAAQKGCRLFPVEEVDTQVMEHIETICEAGSTDPFQHFNSLTKSQPVSGTFPFP